MVLFRYLLFEFLKVTFFCVVSFIAILISTRLHEIAQFAALGANSTAVLWFFLYQIPYVIPIALPVSALISALILTQRLSSHQEITALRASGMSLRTILTPVLIGAAFLSLFNFYVASELASQSHMTTRLLEHQIKTINPLLLLNNKQLSKMKGLYVHTFGPSRIGEHAEDLVIAFWSKQNQRINLMAAKQLTANLNQIDGRQVTLITGMANEEDHGYDNLYLENIHHLTTPVEDLYRVLQKTVWHINPDYLKMTLLLHHAESEWDQLQQAHAAHAGPETLMPLQRHVNKVMAEFIRRFSVGFSVFSFTLMGLAFGLSLGRQFKSQKIALVILLASIFLACFFVAKGYDEQLAPAVALYLIPQVLIIAASVWKLARVSRGIE